MYKGGILRDKASGQKNFYFYLPFNFQCVCLTHLIWYPTGCSQVYLHWWMYAINYASFVRKGLIQNFPNMAVKMNKYPTL